MPGPVVDVVLVELEPLLGVFDHARCGMLGEENSSPLFVVDDDSSVGGGSVVEMVGSVVVVSERCRPVTDAREGGIGQADEGRSPASSSRGAR